MRSVIDAPVVLAYPLGEPGKEAMAESSGPFLLPSVNLAKVSEKLVDRGLDPEDGLRVLGQLAVEHISHDAADARMTAELRCATRSHGLSLGDHACPALGRRLGLPVLTADTAWAGLDPGIDVRLSR